MAFDLLSFLLGKSTGSGGGGGSAALGPKTIRQNGVYRASSDNLDGYNTVTVEVPNTYAAADEGKVVSNGALTAQTSRTVTENGTYDTTLNDEVVVNVSGGGSDDFFDLSKPTGVITTSQTTIGDSSAYGRTGITKVIANNATIVGGNTFNRCSNLEEVVLPLATSGTGTGAYCFQNCTKLKGLVLPSWRQTIYNYFAAGCTSLEYFDSPTVHLSQGHIFDGCTAITVIVLRNTSAVVPLGSLNTFTNSPFASGGAGGTLYVPSALIASYQAATNWSTILGYANNSIQAIEGSQYENYYADGTPIT